MNKRAIVLISSLAVAVVIVVLACSLFAISSVKVVSTTDFALTDAQSSEITAAAAIKKGGSMFSLDEDAVIANIESKVPWVKVITVERRFPATVAINCDVRTPFLAVSVSDGSYAVMDSELKVVSISSKVPDDCLLVQGYILDEIKSGDFAQINWLSQLVSGAVSTYFINDKFIYFIKELRYLNMGGYADNYIELSTNTGAKIIVYDSGDIALMWKRMYQAYMISLEKGVYDISSGYFYPRVEAGEIIVSWSQNLPTV